MRTFLSKGIAGLAILCFSMFAIGCGDDKLPEEALPGPASSNSVTFHDSVIPLDTLPQFEGVPYTTINNNVPFFKEKDIALAKTDFVKIAPFDSLGRCGSVIASLSQKSMPNTFESVMGDVTPTGWHTVKYTGIEGEFLYNRCLLLPSSLSGTPKDVNREIITGTRYLSKVGMVSFADMIFKYLQKNQNHVLYRATPLFEGSDLVCKGVLVEAYSVEDKGRGLSFCAFLYNNQPGIVIDYSNGNSISDDSSMTEIPTIVTSQLKSDYDSTKPKKEKKN